MSQFLRLTHFLRPYVGLLILAGFALIIVSALRLVFPWAIQVLVDDVFVARSYDNLNRLSILLISLAVIQTVVNVGQNYVLAYVGEKVVRDLRVSLYQQLQSLDLKFFADRRTGEITSRLTNDVTAVQTVITSQITTFLSELLIFIGALVLLFWINALLTLLMLLVIPPVILVARIFGKRLRALSTQVQDRVADTAALLEETIGGIRIVKSFAREPYEIERFSAAVQGSFDAALSRARYRAMFVPLISICGFGGLTLVLWFGGRQVLAGQLSQGELVSFLFYTAMIAGSVGTFSGIYAQIQEALGALQRLFELLDLKPTVQEVATPRRIEPLAGRIQLRDVSFAYESREVLHGINLEIAAGEIIALVGPSGGGKSTLFNLLPRFYDPTAGQITLDEVDLRECQLSWLRQQIGVVPQEVVLFSRSVRENISYGRLDASEDEIRAAAEAANAHEFILQLPEGYDTLVGERGVKLSGGQRQRVAIARTILKNPRILLLDEATSALDSESEGAVQEALARLLVGRTTMIIAHRLATVQIAHRIAVIDHGKLVELGTHAELLSQNGLYAHLYALQFQA